MTHYIAALTIKDGKREEYIGELKHANLVEQFREQHGCIRNRTLIVMWRHTYVGSIGQNGTFGNALAHLFSVCKIINVNIAGGMFADAVCECQCTVKFFREFQLKDVDV